MHLFDEYPIKYEAERLPPPVVADLNGDGRKEVLVATHDAKIQVGSELLPRSAASLLLTILSIINFMFVYLDCWYYPMHYVCTQNLSI